MHFKVPRGSLLCRAGIILFKKYQEVIGNFLPGPWWGFITDRWFFGRGTLKRHTDVAFLGVVSYISAFMHGQYTVSRALRKKLCSPIWESSIFCLIFCLRVGGIMHGLLLNITPSRRESSSRMSKYWWMAADSSSFVSGKASKIAFFTVCRVGSQAVSLWSSLTWWSGTWRISEWHRCTLPLLLWLIAHSPPNKLLTRYQLAASPCQACSVSHSHTVQAATVGAPVSWELMQALLWNGD